MYETIYVCHTSIIQDINQRETIENKAFNHMTDIMVVLLFLHNMGHSMSNQHSS
jgi:hypothetical protein